MLWKPVARGRFEASFGDTTDWYLDREQGKYALIELGEEPHGPVVVAQSHLPTHRYEPHWHNSHYVSIILSGSFRVGRKWYHAGDIRMQEAGSVYGPEEAGPEGCTKVNIFLDRTGSAPILPSQDPPAEAPGPSWTPHVALVNHHSRAALPATAD
jgi:hypothetical protein